MRYQVRTIEDDPKTYDIDVFPLPKFLLKLSKNLGKELEAILIDEGRQPVIPYNTIFLKENLDKLEKSEVYNG